jgi:hypothetical protein
MEDGYVTLLEKAGDPYEKEGVIKYRLGERFPRYAQFWHIYVYPNRDEDDPSKLRRGLPRLLEELFGIHYSVWYHITVAYRQIANLAEFPSEVRDPLLHLASSIDMVERLLATALVERSRLNGDEPVKALCKVSYAVKTLKLWGKYLEEFEQFRKQYKPVNLRLHNVGELLEQLVSEQHKRTLRSFQGIAGKVRHYRNTVAHRPVLLTLLQNGNILLPKEDKLHELAGACWSSLSREVVSADFVEAGDLLIDLADNLVTKANDAWEILLDEMEQIASSQEYSRWLTVSPKGPQKRFISDGPSGGITSSATVGISGIPYMRRDTGGSAEWDPSRDRPPDISESGADSDRDEDNNHFRVFRVL